MGTHQFLMFEYALYLVFDVFYAIIAWAIVRLISRSHWQRHLTWAVPSAVSSSMFVIHCIILNTHHFFAWGTPRFWASMFLTNESLWYVSAFIGMYSTWIFWRMLRDIMRQTDAKDLFTQIAAADILPGVWPPPPIRTKE